MKSSELIFPLQLSSEALSYSKPGNILSTLSNIPCPTTHNLSFVQLGSKQSEIQPALQHKDKFIVLKLFSVYMCLGTLSFTAKLIQSLGAYHIKG